VFNVDFSLNHGHARPFGAEFTKRPSRDSYRAIRGANVQVPGSTLRGLHDDAPWSRWIVVIATAGADRQFRALIHFHCEPSKSRTLAWELAPVRMNSPCPTSSPTFNARSPAAPML